MMCHTMACHGWSCRIAKEGIMDDSSKLQQKAWHATACHCRLLPSIAFPCRPLSSALPSMAVPLPPTLPPIAVCCRPLPSVTAGIAVRCRCRRHCVRHSRRCCRLPRSVAIAQGCAETDDKGLHENSSTQCTGSIDATDFGTTQNQGAKALLK